MQKSRLFHFLFQLATPRNGHAAANLSVDHTQTPVYSWDGLAMGSHFLKELFYSGEQPQVRRRLPDTIVKYLLFSFINTESGDETVNLTSQIQAETQDEADRLYGYPVSHMEFLNIPKFPK